MRLIASTERRTYIQYLNLIGRLHNAGASQARHSESSQPGAAAQPRVSRVLAHLAEERSRGPRSGSGRLPSIAGMLFHEPILLNHSHVAILQLPKLQSYHYLTVRTSDLSFIISSWSNTNIL